jgi:hypothetical protein
MKMVALAFNLDRTIHFIDETASDPHGYCWYIAFVILAIVFYLVGNFKKRD